MRRISVRILTALVLLAAFTGCKKNRDVLPVRFSALLMDWDHMQTVALPEGMTVGIIAGEPVNMPNVRTSASGTELIPEVSFYWARGQKSTTHFMAYAPYDPSMTGLPFDFSVREDQRTEEGFAASDFISGTADVTRPHVVPFILEHRLSKLVINVVPTAESGDVTALTLRNAPRKGSMPLTNVTFSEVGDEGTIQALKTARNSFSAIIMPSAVALSLLVETTRGNHLLCTFPSPTDFQQGKVHELSINLSDSTAMADGVTFQLSVSDWSDGGNLPFL